MAARVALLAAREELDAPKGENAAAAKGEDGSEVLGTGIEGGGAVAPQRAVLLGDAASGGACGAARRMLTSFSKSR